MTRPYRYLAEDFESLEDYYYSVSDYLDSAVQTFVPKDAFYSVLAEPATRPRLLKILDIAVSEKLNTTFPLGAMIRFGEELSAVRNRLKSDPIRKTIDELGEIISQFRLSIASDESQRIELLRLIGDLVYSESLDRSKIDVLLKHGEAITVQHLTSERRRNSLSDSNYREFVRVLNRLESLSLLSELNAYESSEG